MVRVNEVTSTEKLLDVIRSKSDSIPDDSSSSSHSPAPSTTPQNTAPTVSKKSYRSKNTVTVGIDIGYDCLRLIKVARIEGKLHVIDCKSAPINQEQERNSAEFIHFLKSELTLFCGLTENLDLWVMIPATNIDVRHIRIPKVPKKQIDGAVYWTAKKEGYFDEHDSILDFEVQGEIMDQGIPKLSVMAYIAPILEIDAMKKLFLRIGIPLSGITIVPFAIQNIFRTNWVPVTEESVANMFIGRDFSRIDIFSGGSLVLSRDIKAGTNSMVESIIDSFAANGKQLSIEEARDILLSLSLEPAQVKSKDKPFDQKQEEIFEMLHPALERLIRQIELTFEHYTVNLGRDRIRKIYISSTMNVYKPLIDHIGNQLGIEGNTLDVIEQSAPCLSTELKGATLSEKVAFAPAIGLALSDNSRTPNLLFTYKDKNREKTVTRINKRIFTFFVLSVALCSIAYLYEETTISRKKGIVAGLEADLARQVPVLNRDEITRLAAKSSQKNRLSKEYSRRYLGMSVISELSDLTPSDIRLKSVNIDLSQKLSTNKDQAGGIQSRENLIIEGSIPGSRSSAEAALSGYVLKLGSSPLFKQINIHKSSVEDTKSGDALRFTINIKTGSV